MTSTLALPGRILFLSQDPDVVSRQIKGRTLDLEACKPLRDDISTDEMTPQITGTMYDQRLGGILLIAYKAGAEQPIARRSILDGGFSVIVGGRRYGKGSSREHSPLGMVCRNAD